MLWASLCTAPVGSSSSWFICYSTKGAIIKHGGVIRKHYIYIKHVISIVAVLTKKVARCLELETQISKFVVVALALLCLIHLISSHEQCVVWMAGCFLDYRANIPLQQ